LDYVRKLRNESAEGVGQQLAQHPYNTIGVHLQARLVAATSNLQDVDANKEKKNQNDEKIQEKISVKRYQPPDLKTYTHQEIKELLLSKVIYNDHDIVALWKPYGLKMFDGAGESAKRGPGPISLEKFLPFLATKLGCEQLLEVHRLDATTTGVLLYAKTKEMRERLKKLFESREIRKTYLALTNGVPKATEGVVNIPVGVGRIGNRFRMTLRPDYMSSNVETNKKNSKAANSVAITDYRVVCSHNSAALVQCNMRTGRKHQIRLHLGLGLGTPVLGDHKFSLPDAMDRPQRVKGDIVQRLGVRSSKCRDLPIYLHARRVVIPGVLPGGDLVIEANLPHFFTKAMRKLKLKANRNEN